jgi:hypothetical protein
MSLDKPSLKAQLLTQYAHQLDRLLAQLDDDEDLDLTQIEDMALDLRRQVGQDVTTALVVHESAQSEVDVLCPDCQRRMRPKGRKGKWIKARTGDVRIERPYYYCDHCRRGLFPPG